MQITKKQIDAVKRSNDLVSVIQSHGIKLRKKGSNYVGLCPFHKEKTPYRKSKDKPVSLFRLQCRRGCDRLCLQDGRDRL